MLAYIFLFDINQGLLHRVHLMKQKFLDQFKEFIDKENYQAARSLFKRVMRAKKDPSLDVFLQQREKNLQRLNDDPLYVLPVLDVLTMALEADLDEDMYVKWRYACYGKSPIKKVDSRVWEWLIRTRTSGYMSRLVWGFGDEYPETAGWSFARFGQSKTVLPDGRIVYIAGEHEDSYDEDFFIYNDVVVIHLDDRIDIYTYSEDVFPPTDFHSATLIDDKIVIVGRLGYDKELTVTPVYILDINDFSIQEVETVGVSPSRLHEHEAVLSADGNRISFIGGKIRVPPDRTPIENIDNWELDVKTWSWYCRKNSQWMRWKCKREDGLRNTLWQARRTLDKHLEYHSDIDYKMRALSCLYEPPVSFQPMNSQELRTHLICIDGVVVRYSEESYHIVVTVEGSLPTSILDILIEDLLHKLSIVEGEIFYAKEVVLTTDEE